MKFLLCASYLHVSIFFPLAASQQGTPKLDLLLLKTPDKHLQLKHPPDDNKHQEAHLVNDTDQHTVLPLPGSNRTAESDCNSLNTGLWLLIAYNKILSRRKLSINHKIMSCLLFHEKKITAAAMLIGQ